MNKDDVLEWLEREGTQATIDGMTRYGIPNDRAFGVSMGTMQALAKRVGKDHDLAAALWETRWYEARTVAALVDESNRVTSQQMDGWAADFDNWAICDTACFHLFDRTPFAWDKAHEWSSSPQEFVKRAAFALLASLVAHDKGASDTHFLAVLPLIEQGAHDERNFVKKAVNWALRTIGKRNLALNAAALATAERLALSDTPSARWVGKDAARELASAKVRGRLNR
jgi:3-methyladenine DNA glycosylase AlkD